MLHRVFGLILGLLFVTACSAQTPPAELYQAERDYAVIEPAQPTPGDTIEVIEVFGYSCPACAMFQPLVNEWYKTLPDDARFNYIPAPFGGIWEVYARVFYTAETMGVLPHTHDALFKAIHEERRGFKNLEEIAEWFGGHGVNKDEFLATMQSFAVNTKMARASQQVPRYGVQGTPTMIVAGKYRVTLEREGGFEKMLKVVDFLIEKERAARQAA